MAEVSIIIAFIAGIISFLSPCVLPLVPGFLAYLSSIGGKEINRTKIFLNSIFFVLGFSFIFGLLGILLNTILKNIAYSLQTWLSKIAGVIIIIFGLYLLKLIKINFLEREHKLKVRKQFSIYYVTSFVFGLAFAVGWTPCVSAILGSILALAVSSPGSAFILLVSYALGLGIPFLLVGLFSTEAIKLILKYQKFLKYFNIVMGIILIILGILVFTQTLPLVANLEIVNRFLLK